MGSQLYCCQIPKARGHGTCASFALASKAPGSPARASPRRCSAGGTGPTFTPPKRNQRCRDPGLQVPGDGMAEKSHVRCT